VATEAENLGINPADLLAGVMQPLLYEIGVLYEKGEVTVVQEHLFSVFIKDLIQELKKKQVTLSKNANECDVLLACADGNYHEFGLNILEFKLKQQKLNVNSLIPGVPSEQLFAYAKQIGAKVLGLSLSLEAQLPEIEKLAKLRQNDKSYQPTIYVGGFVVRKLEFNYEGIIIHKADINHLVQNILERIESIKAAS
jgi:methanogenic corrinoid protein MtbC1